MYRGFVGTVLSHFLSLISTLWTIFKIHNCKLQTVELNYARFGLFLVAVNSSLALVRYGSSDGYKLRSLHIITLNVSAIVNFSITEAVLLLMNKSTFLLLIFPALNIIPLLSNVLAKDYRIKIKLSDTFIAFNCLYLSLNSFLNENYYGVALSLSYFFGYFVMGDSGYFLDTEVPSVDAFQILTIFTIALKNFYESYEIGVIIMQKTNSSLVLWKFLNTFQIFYLFKIVLAILCSIRYILVFGVHKF